MIPVRVPAAAALHIAAIKDVPDGHPLHGAPCPACGAALAGPTALVYVGADPDSRREAGWMTGSAVAVHAECATVRALCAVCRAPAGWVECPTGGWWRHETHPADGHDAAPGEVAS